MQKTDNGSPGHFAKTDIGYQGFVQKIEDTAKWISYKRLFESGTCGSLIRWILGRRRSLVLMQLGEKPWGPFTMVGRPHFSGKVKVHGF